MSVSQLTVHPTSYLSFRNRAISLLQQIREIADEAHQSRITSAEKRLYQDRVKVLVVGEFSRGKSTFINAIMGEPILPSRVTPTTATINVIRGGVDRAALIHYSDGKKVHLPLPPTQVNKFLSDVVTSTNEDSQKITEVVVTVPGRLDHIMVDIVDTPGVNDLNKLREEVTFRYLHECDVALVILDSHQPLTESERIFLKNRVVGADVNKLAFVVNRIDERSGDEANFDPLRIVRSVQERLFEQVGIRAPKVFAVSALQALKAKCNRVHNDYLSAFEAFEEEFLSFANSQATTQRAISHNQRLEAILTDIAISIENEAKALECDAVQRSVATKNQEAKLTTASELLGKLPSLIRIEFEDQRSSIEEEGKAELARRETELMAKLKELQSVEVLDGFLSSVRDSIRVWNEGLHRQSNQVSTTIANNLRRKYPELFDASMSLILANSVPLKLSGDIDVQINDEDVSAKGSELSMVDMSFAAVVALISTTIIGGPVAMIIAAICGAGFSNSFRNAAAKEQAFEQRKQSIRDAVAQLFNTLKEQLSGMVDRIVQRECELVLQTLSEKANLTLTGLTKSIETLNEIERESETVLAERLERNHERKFVLQNLQREFGQLS